MSERTFTVTPHPVLLVPTAEEAMAMGEANWLEAMNRREQLIRRETQEPLWHAYEPPIWKVCDALAGFPWLNQGEAEKIRLNLGFEQPVNVLYLLGGQRGSKTEYAANRMSRLQQRQPNGISWNFHNTLPSSRENQQPLFWKFLPANLKVKPILSQTTYIAYKAKTGFSDESYVLPNMHRVRFLSYDIELRDLQGSNLNAAWADEFIDPERIETLKARVAVKNGPLIITLAPIEGYTPTVQLASEGARVLRESIAFLNPADGGPRDVARYLGLTEEEAEQLRQWLGRKQQPPYPNVPWSRPERCENWLTGEPSQPTIPAGRKFKMVPRIQKPADPEGKSAIVHFHGSDNQYGNPISLYLLNSQVSEEISNRIFYGVAKKGIMRKFPKFDRKVHVMPAAAIPATGSNYLWVDPAEGRNFFMTWIRITPKAAFIYREWPGRYEIPGLGIPGPWAIPHGRLGDGAAGPGQESFGFGLVDYKREIARLEGWTDATLPKPPDKADRDWIRTWFPEHGTKESIVRRFVDSRFASTPHMENDRPVTLLENFAELGVFFEPTPGDDIHEGVTMLNDLMGYDTTHPVDALNCPKLFISEDCHNTIFAIETWRNQEGRRGATKDPIDNLRYFALQGVLHVEADTYASEGGGHY